MRKKNRKFRFDSLEDRLLMASIPVQHELPLHSLPGAPAMLYLDFNGHVQNEAIGSVLGLGGFDPGATPPWSGFGDTDPLTFSDSEQTNIRTIWEAVAEDFAPFNIDVTTFDPDPGQFHSGTPYLRVVISGDDDFSGNGFEGLTAEDPTGGYSAYADPDQPNVSYVFGINSDGKHQSVRALAEAASHEASHSFGNSHNYFGVANAKKAPIMFETGPIPKNGFQFAARGVWSDKGGVILTSSGPRSANRDEMAIIASDDNGFGYRPDDHSDFFQHATPLSASGGFISAEGIIGKTDDLDYFRFETGGGSLISVKVNPPPGVGNLDARLWLYDAAGTPLGESNDPTKLQAEIHRPLIAGSYFVKVGSFGEYGDVGRYKLSVQEFQGAQIVQAEIQGVTSSTSMIRVTFDEPIDPSSFTKEDVRISFGGSVMSVQPTYGGNFKTWSITVKRPTTSAQWSVIIGPNINDWFGNAMDQNRNGIKGETTDALRLNFLGNGFGTLDPGWSNSTSTKTIRLAPRFVDAVFQQT